MKLQYKIVQRYDGLFALCEIRYMKQSINSKQIYKSHSKKDCIERLKQIRGKNDKNI